jgi:hypothetical protein
MFVLDDMVARMTFKPKQSPVFDSPADYGLAFEDVEFKAADGVTLRGWLIPGGSDRVVIQSHVGVVCCRSGYTNKGKGIVKSYPTDIHFLNQAKYLHDAGYAERTTEWPRTSGSATTPSKSLDGSINTWARPQRTCERVADRTCTPLTHSTHSRQTRTSS